MRHRAFCAHAKSNGVHILVAGDVYDSEAPNSHTLRAPIERMKPFADVHWHLLPGNHDPHRPEGIWDRVAQLGLPSNIHLHLTPTPFALDDNACLAFAHERQPHLTLEQHGLIQLSHT